MTRQPSDHFDGERFFNPDGANGRPFSAVPKMAAERRAVWPVEVPVHVRRVEPRDPQAWATVTFVGHATFVIQAAGVTFITDPMFSQRASPLSFIGPRRVRQPGVSLADLPPIDVVLLSHNHYDHCDRASLAAIARSFDPLFITPIGNHRMGARAGFRHIVELDWWERTTHASVSIDVAPAQHFSARTPFDRNRALWGSFMLGIGGRRLFFGGDSGYGPHFGEIRRRFGAVDLALLPIGAYEPRWFMRDIHMNPEEAAQAHLDLEAARSIGMHFGTFQLTTEAIDAPVLGLRQARIERGIADGAFTVLDFGESVHVP
ncbi:MAG: MBL fold metallo-hydrolase [Vicinamibacterales bacterium]